MGSIQAYAWDNLELLQVQHQSWSQVPSSLNLSLVYLTLVQPQLFSSEICMQFLTSVKNQYKIDDAEGLKGELRLKHSDQDLGWMDGAQL